MKVNKKILEKYLKEKFGEDAFIKDLNEIGKGVYGTAYLVDFNIGKKNKRLVLKTMKCGGFGHDFKADIAHNLILANDTFNKLPKHIKSFDVLAGTPEKLASIGDAEEYYILLEEATGTQYDKILDEIFKNGLKDEHREQAKKLAEYLADIHKQKKPDQALCIRRARDLVGHGEYIMGVLDGYPKDSFLSADEKTEIVKLCVEWWQKLQNYSKRFCVVHGDYHPFNIMFKNEDFTVLDRSRGEFGEPAEDLASLAINYIFWSLVKHGTLDGDFRELFDIFFSTYLEKTKDIEVLKVLQPFFAFRAIVVANPVFYPDGWFEERGADAGRTRRKLIDFAKKCLRSEEIKIDRIGGLF